MMLKRCTKCEEEKSVEKFYMRVNGAGKEVPRGSCKACESHSHKMRAKRKKVTPKRKVCSRCHVRKKSSEFYRRAAALDGLFTECKQCNNGRKRDFCRDNREQVNAYGREFSAQPDQKRKKKEYCEANREVNRRGCRAWYIRNRDKAAMKSDRRRLRETLAFVEPVSRRKVWERDDEACQICKSAVDFADMHLDHIIPISRGGEHSYANTQTTCATCNLSKGARTAS